MRPVCKDFICFHMGTRSTKKVEFPCALIESTIITGRQSCRIEGDVKGGGDARLMEDGQCLVNR